MSQPEMRYFSTRGGTEELTFEEVSQAGFKLERRISADT
jgi:hypothetical protein